MRAAVSLVLALTLRARPVHLENPHSDQAHSHCEDSPLIRIIYEHDKWKYYDYRYIEWAKGENKVSIPYGSLLDVFCGCPINADKLTMERSGEKLATRKEYINVIASARKQDVLTSKEVFVCTDVESTCTSSMIISVTPAFEVISHNVQIFVDNDHINYTVQYGEPLTVLCSGPDATRLVMSQDEEPLLRELESNTTIKRFVKKTDLLISEYVCTDNITTYNSSVTIKVLPAIHLQSQNETMTSVSVYEGLQFYYWEYRNSTVEVNCFGPRTVKLIGRGEDNIPFTENFINVNPHRVKYINTLKLGQWYFECSESDSPDYVTRVKIAIRPRMEVRSPNIRRVESTDTIQYGIKYGDTIEVICSGTDSDELQIRYNKNYEVGSYKNKGIEVTLNTTAIKYTLKDPGMDNNFGFWCSKEGPPRSVAFLSVGVLPADVTDFRCVSHGGLILNCTWTAPSDAVNFTLSYVENYVDDDDDFENAIITRICKKPKSSKKSKICILDYEYINEQEKIKDWVLLLQYCNSIGCSNQTFHIDHLSIVKLDPVWYIRVLNIKPRGVALKWYSNPLHVSGVHLYSYNDFNHKVQYWYSGIEPREVNSSLITCPEDCEIELNLPCPGQFYEFWIYRKLKRAVGDEFWSDPRAVTFRTVGNKDETNDATCSWKPRKTPAVMEYFVQEDKQEVYLEMQALKEKVISLKDKLATIRALKQQGKGTP